MAKYIDTSKVTVPKGFFDDLNVPKLFEWLESQPTADVVPKSEVETMQKKYEREIEDLESTQEITPEAKHLVDTKADKIISLLTEINKTQEQVKQEVAREIFDDIERLMFATKIGTLHGFYYSTDLKEYVAELKKKYIG